MSIAHNIYQKYCICRRRFSRLVSVVLIGSCLAGAAFAAASIRGHGECAGTITLTLRGGELMEVEIETVGNIAHPGRSRVTANSVADFSGSVPTPVSASTGLVRAANGDTITFSPGWTTQTVGWGVLGVTGPSEVAEGTGRFSGVAGGGNYQGRIDTNTGQVTAEIDELLLR
jgi:hypothetical protein